jgi:paraquat-inducible protein B
MTETADGPGIPQARRVEKKKRRVSTIWIIPIVAALVGLGIAVQRILSEGPEIRISFQTGEGIEAGKTVVKYKDIEIGMVTDVELSKDRKGILVTAEMEKGVEDMLDNDARFWVVKPRVTLSGVSGIGALISGNYIGFEPGARRRGGATSSAWKPPRP